MMDQAIARAIGAMPSTTQPAAAPRLVGEFQGYVDGILPSVRWLDRKNMPQVGDRLFAIPAHAAVPRSWSILLTSANHGTVGPLGSTFPHAGEHHERVQVVEIVEAGTPPAPDVDLAGLVRLPLTDEQIAAGAAIECDHGAPIGRNAAIDVFDAMCAAAPVAAQAGQVAPAQVGELAEAISNLCCNEFHAGSPNEEVRRAYGRGYRQARADAVELAAGAAAGQVAVPEDRQALANEVLIAAQSYANCHYEDAANRGRGGPGFGPKTSRAEGRLLAAVQALSAAPSAPAVAQQAPAQAEPGWISVDERLPDSGYCLATYRNRHGKLRIIRAKHARQFEIDACEDAIDQGNCEYNEADDTYYLKAGWLECIDNWDDYSSIYVTEGEVTHWMPLPALPGAQASTSGERQAEGGA